MTELTPEQKIQIDSWVNQRDAILLDIAEKRTESEKLTATNRDVASSNTEIANKIQQSIGRLEELEKKEKERALLIVSEIADLSAEKSVLQAQVSGLSKEIAVLKDSKNILVGDIDSITKIHEAVFARTGEIERVIGATVTINSQNAQEIKNILV